MIKVYHGTPTVLTELKAGSWLTDNPRVAYAYGRQRCYDEKIPQPKDTPVYVYETVVDPLRLKAASVEEGDFRVLRITESLAVHRVVG